MASITCPVCGRIFNEGEGKTCPNDGWTLVGENILGKPTSTQEQAYQRELAQAKKNWVFRQKQEGNISSPRRAKLESSVGASVRIIETRLLSGHQGCVESVAFSPDGGTLISASNKGEIFAWDTLEGNLIFKLDFFSGEVGQTQANTSSMRSISSVAFNSDNRFFASRSNDGLVQIWNTAGRQVRQLDSGDTRYFGPVSFHPNQPWVAAPRSRGLDSVVCVWDVTNGKLLQTVSMESSQPSQLYTLAFSPDGTKLVGAGEARVIFVWDAKSGEELLRFQELEGSIRSIAFDHDGTILASGGDDITVRLWAVNSGGLLMKLEGHAGLVRGVGFDSSGQCLISGAEDDTIRFWNTATGRELGVEQLPALQKLRCLAVSQTRKMLAIGTETGTVGLCRVRY